MANHVRSVTITTNGTGGPSTDIGIDFIQGYWFLTRGSILPSGTFYRVLYEFSCLPATAVLLVLISGRNSTQKQALNRGNDLSRWIKGQSGNPAGRKRKRLFDDHLREALAAKRGAAAKALVQRLIGEAVQGNVPALKLIAERIGGKPKSAEESAAGNGESLTLEQVRAKLAELLSRPEVRQSLQAMLTEPKSQTDSIQ